MCFAKKLIILVSILTFFFASFSCSYKQQQLLFEGKNQRDSTAKKVLTTTTYQIQPHDLLQIRNLQNRKFIVDEPVTLKNTSTTTDNGQTYLVETDSTIALPIIGRIKVAGLTRQQAAVKIENHYRKELKDPIIDLKIINLKVTVLGEVKNQGVYHLAKDYTSLIEIIGEAGGLTEKAACTRIKILRGGLPVSEVIEVDLDNVQTLSDPKIILQNNDIIYIAKNKRAIRSEKLQNMSSVLQPVITLLNTALIIYTLTR